MIDFSQGFTIEREFAASPERVWQAWTDEELAAQWLHGMHAPRESVQIDARVGGRIVYTMIDESTGKKFPTCGVYRELAPPNRLVLTWGNADDPDEERMVISIDLAPTATGTHMRFELRGAPGAPGDGYIYDGWVEALDLVGTVVTGVGSR